MRLTRRQVLAGLALTATPLAAEPGVASAASLARAVDPPADISELLIHDADGQPVSMTDWRGRWVVLNLWGPWCLPCKREMPSLLRLSQVLSPDRAIVLPLAFDWRGPLWVKKFYREEKITGLPVLMGDGENLNAVLGLSDLPTTVLINPEGHHAFTIPGEATWDDAETLAWLEKLIG